MVDSQPHAGGAGRLVALALGESSVPSPGEVRPGRGPNPYDVFLTGDDEAGDSEETNGRTLRPLRLSGGRRQVPSAHQETEAAHGRNYESEGGDS
jgi:hypothetical protein